MIQCALRTKNEHISAYSALGTDALFLYHDICGVALIFVSDTICNEAQIKTFAETFKLWLEEHEIISGSRVSLIYGDVTGVTRENFSDYYSTYHENKKLNVSGDYHITIYGGDTEQNYISLTR